MVGRILIAHALSEFSQYEFYITKITMSPKHVILTNNENEGNGIYGLISIENPFTVKISPIQDIREIGSLASDKQG